LFIIKAYFHFYSSKIYPVPLERQFDFSRLSTGSDWETHTDVPKKYDKVELQDLLKQLIKK
jgi:hypothetical protein